MTRVIPVLVAVIVLGVAVTCWLHFRAPPDRAVELPHLGHTPAYHKSALAPQAAQALATEHAERCRNPVLVVDITDRD